MNTTDAISFSDLLRRYRMAAGLTREALAERAGLSVRGIADLESGARRAPYRDTVQRLSAALALDAECRQGLEAAARPPRMTSAMRGALDGAAAVSAITSPPFVVPEPPTPLIGREADVAEVRARLLHGAERLVTLTGAGGVGKTRLAIELAGRLRPDFADGVYFVALDALRDPALVAPAIARALGVRQTDARPLVEVVSAFLAERHVLLVLDNFEQLLPAAMVVSDLLAACPRLTVVATSREPLRLRAEYVVAVSPLELPDPAHVTDPARLVRAPAVALFVTRAHAAAGGFTLTATNAGAVAELCRRLDGLPLAIELAAAGVRAASPQGILDRLRQHAGVLDGGFQDLPARQQGLRAALDWSYDLLTDPERRLLERLAVFAGGCDIESAEAVCADREQGTGNREQAREAGTVPCSLFPVPSESLFGLLTSLVEKSLIVAAYDGEAARYRLLETIRQYAAERLDASGEAGSVLNRRLRWMLDLAEQAAPQMRGSEQAVWLDRLETEHDNLRAVLQWAFENEHDAPGLRLAGLVSGFWHARGYLSEGRRWLEEALRRAEPASTAPRADALGAAGRLAQAQGDFRQAYTFYEQCLALRREIGDIREIAIALSGLAGVARDMSRTEEAGARWEESLSLFRELDDDPWTARDLNNLAIVADDLGESERAVELFEESLAIHRARREQADVARVLHNLVHPLLASGDHQRALSACEEALTIRRALGDRRGVARTIAYRGVIAREMGDTARALTSFQEALTRFHDLDDRSSAAACLNDLAGLLAACGLPERAARVWGAAEVLHEATGAPVSLSSRADYERRVAAARAALPEPAFAAAWADGAAMSLDQAITYALADSDPHPQVSSLR